MVYKVVVTETYQKNIAVPAGSEEEAHQRAHDAWTNDEFRLDVEDFRGVEFYVAGEASWSDEKIERKE